MAVDVVSQLYLSCLNYHNVSLLVDFNFNGFQIQVYKIISKTECFEISNLWLALCYAQVYLNLWNGNYIRYINLCNLFQIIIYIWI